MDEVAKDVRFRTVTMAVKCDMLDEARILAMLQRWNRGIKGFAYIKHDKDTYTASDAKQSCEKADGALKELDAAHANGLSDNEYAEKRKAIKGTVVTEGQHKDDHWHILIDFGKNAKSVNEIAVVLNIPSNLVCNVRGRKRGFTNMLAYMTHITKKAREEEKWEYPYDDVKALRFPDDPSYSDFHTYADFAEAFEKNAIDTDVTALSVMQGKITPEELKARRPDYYLNNLRKVKQARLEYVNSLPTPSVLFNFYVGAIDSSHDGRGGRIGKGLTCQILALSHLRAMYPTVDFSDKSLDDLTPYIFYAGGSNVEFDGYDGQPIIIWSDVRGYDLVKLYGDVGKLFDALDTHPKPKAFNVKYGRVYLKNSINIFDGIQSYQEFINSLSEEYRKSEEGKGHFVQKEDKSQAKGRWPFFIEVSPEFITLNAQLDYLLGSSKHNFRHTVNNDLQVIAQNSALGRHDWLGADKYVKLEEKVRKNDGVLPVPLDACYPIDLDAEYDFYCREYEKQVAAGKIIRYRSPLCRDDWERQGAPTRYYELEDRWYRPDTRPFVDVSQKPVEDEWEEYELEKDLEPLVTDNDESSDGCNGSSPVECDDYPFIDHGERPVT